MATVGDERLAEFTDNPTHYASEIVDMAKEIQYLRSLRSQAGVSEAVHRHKKRGTDYVLIGIGKMQAEHWWTREVDHHGRASPVPVDMREVAIYRSATDPIEIWVRPREEFEDGRFEALTASLQGETK